ncbi:MAG TPA: hypothetical protein VHR72_03725, partial [Gemmataceae bacterium]|nr:hypothetical protein [Gemmataceae bacterium]
MNVESYRSYKNLPPLAGLADFVEASRPGLSVEACVARLKRIHYALIRLHEVFTARITAEPIYELKTLFSHHAYLCAEHAQAIRSRIGEMREPPLGLEAIPHPALAVLFDEIRSAPTTIDLLRGIYATVVPALARTVESYRGDTNPLADAPSVRVLRFLGLELGDLLSLGRRCIECLDERRGSSPPTSVDPFAASSPAGINPAAHQGAVRQDEWLDLLDRCLVAAGGLDGAGPTADVPDRWHSALPYVYDRFPRRDERWQDPWNQGVNAEAFLYDAEMPAPAKALMMLFKRIREIDVPEMMASILVETKEQPWEYYLGMSRQLWDEARHAMMGEVGFVALGIDWTQARITHNWSYRLNTECTPIERHAVLYFIEQGLMTKTGKRFEWEVSQASGIPLMATIQDFDWADEVLHAQLGQAWYIPAIGDRKKALDYGDKCWSRVLSNWQSVLDRGLTAHANWWPAIYGQACRNWGREPDP